MRKVSEKKGRQIKARMRSALQKANGPGVKRASAEAVNKATLFCGYDKKREEILPTPSQDDDERVAGELLSRPPSAADEETFWFQQPLILVEKEQRPPNDKLNKDQAVLECMYEVTDKVLHQAALAKDTFVKQPELTCAESQDRAHVEALMMGLQAVVPPTLVETTLGPIQYLKKVVCNGNDDDSCRKEYKRWRMDIVGYSYMAREPWHYHGKPCQVPRLGIEAKWSATDEDIFQSSLSAAKLFLSRLKQSRPIDRMYVKVWTSLIYKYGIMDVFGFIRIRDGKVVPDSFNAFKRQADALRSRKGHAFPAESFARCPQDIRTAQKMWDDRDNEFHELFGVHLADGEFPVGILYLNNEERLFPSGKQPVSQEEAARFVQGLLRILVGNSVLNWTAATVQDNCARRRARLTELRSSFYKESLGGEDAAMLKRPAGDHEMKGTSNKKHRKQ